MPELQKLHLKPLWPPDHNKRRPGEELRPCLHTAGKPMGSRIITKVPVNKQELHLRGKYSACLRLRDTGALIISFILS